MKKNVKTKKTKFLSHNVEYFTSNKAIDALLKSKWAEGADALFATREKCIEFLDIMLEHKFFHRAKKVPVVLEEVKAAGGGSKAAKKEKTADNEGKKESKKEKDTEAEAEASAGGGAGDATAGADKKEKRKRKIRLDMHPEQLFVDGSEAYVWIYDPIPIHCWAYGLILLLGAIGICLFPLWPPMLRMGVYYLSVAAAGFLVFILALTVVRLIIFTLVWLVTGGKLHFWIFPNLTEDVGFLPSFWPLYEVSYKELSAKQCANSLEFAMQSKYLSEADSNKDEKRSKNKNKKEKDSGDEDETAAEPDDAAAALEADKIEEIKEHDADMELRHRKKAANTATTETETESQSSGGEAAAESDAKDG